MVSNVGGDEGGNNNEGNGDGGYEGDNVGDGNDDGDGDSDDNDNGVDDDNEGDSDLRKTPDKCIRNIQILFKLLLGNAPKILSPDSK